MQITNNSNHEIFVILTPTYDSTVPNKPNSKILSGSTKSYIVNTGTMNLFIWHDNSIVWSGIVPTLIKGPLIYTGNISYNGVIIPQFHSTPAKRNWLLLIVILLVIIGVILVFFLNR